MSVGQTDSLRADLEHVLAESNREPDASAAPDGGGGVSVGGLTEDAPILTPEPETKGDRARDESGKFVKQEAKAAPKPAEKKPATVVELKPKLGEATKPAPTEAPPKPVTPTHKAPASWRPEMREKWASLPPEVQAEVARREREVATALQQAAPLRQEAEGWRQVLQPHAGMLQAFGADPRQTVGQLLQAQAVLHYGSPQQKAGLIARLVTGYNVTVDDLAAALNGASDESARPPQQQFRDPRFDQFMATLRQQKVAREAQLDQDAKSTWETFAAEHEHAEALRQHIGAYLGAGLADSLETAYDMALHAHPEFRKVVSQQEAAKLATEQDSATAAKKAAALSLRNDPGGTGGGEDRKPGTVGDDLRYVAAQLARR